MNVWILMRSIYCKKLQVNMSRIGDGIAHRVDDFDIFDIYYWNTMRKYLSDLYHFNAVQFVLFRST